jgi:hypothetical protein
LKHLRTTTPELLIQVTHRQRAIRFPVDVVEQLATALLLQLVLLKMIQVVFKN